MRTERKEERMNRRKKEKMRRLPKKKAIMEKMRRHRIERNSNNRKVIKSEALRKFS